VNPTKFLLLAVFQLSLFSFVLGQTVSITGTVTDPNGKKVSGAGVKLKNLSLRTVTDTAGHFAFTGSAAGPIKPQAIYGMPFFSGNFLNFTVTNNNDRVLIETFDCKGRCVHVAIDKAMSAGTYKTLPFPASFSSQMYLCRVTIGNSVSHLMKRPLIGQSMGEGSGVFSSKQSLQKSLAKESVTVDTLIISRSGYSTQKQALTAYTGDFPISLQWTISVVLDMDSYQGIDWPMTASVWDLSLSSATVSATVASTSYPTPIALTLAKDTSNPGSYATPIGFTVSKATTLGDTVRVKDNDTVTVSYLKAGVVSATSKAVWNGLPPDVRPSVSIYLGLKLPININADDRNISDSTITIHLASHKDTVGINVLLHALAGSPGSYTGEVYPSLTTSTAFKTIAVRPPVDTLTTIYQSPAFSKPVISDAKQGTALLWKCNETSILPDSLGAGYHGTTSKMKISMENDHIVASTVNVNVKSKKDTTGISVPLAVNADTTWKFGGSVGFTLGNSSAANGTISVAGSDTITITYKDMIMSPAETLHVKTTWNP
jgi:hypothetical protein